MVCHRSNPRVPRGRPIGPQRSRRGRRRRQHRVRLRVGPRRAAVPAGIRHDDQRPRQRRPAITVGSSSTMPHATGVSYFSSKGPTGDGRMKPDLVAPGERVVSAGAGVLLAKAQALVPQGHVCREFRHVDGRPARVGGGRRISIGASGVCGSAGGRQTGSARRGHRHRPFANLSGPRHGGHDAGYPVGMRRWR